MQRISIVSIFFLAFMVIPWVRAEENKEAAWTRFRGPNGSGTAIKSGLGLPWLPTGVRQVPLPGVGHGSPSVYNDTAFLLSADPKDATRYLLAIDLKTGAERWKRSYSSVPHKLHKFSSYASSTPCVDAERVYFAWADPEHTIVRALSHDGSEVWVRDFGRYVTQHGFGMSPIRVDDLVLLLNTQDAEELPPGVAPGSDRMIALNAKSGETVWETQLPTTRVCYGVPCVWEHEGKKELVCITTGEGMFGMDLSTGAVLWNHDCFSQRICSSAFLVGDLLIGSHGSGGGKDNRLIAFDLSKKQERFQIAKKSVAPYVPTPVATGDTLFLWSDAGIVSAVDLIDGNTIWSMRIGGDFSSSPIIVGDKLLNVSHTGAVTILSASREFQKIATIETDLTVRSTMVPAGDRLLLRGDSQLWIISNPTSP
jgi:outer membrane protein assembly factor BamB